MAHHRRTHASQVQPWLVDTAPLADARSTADALALAFDLFGPRRCLGSRPRDPVSGAVAREYEWMTYSEVGEARAPWLGPEARGEKGGERVRCAADLMRPEFRLSTSLFGVIG